ncbi:MAG: methyltransferase domain-containing protein, partial [Nocardioidaceae bacterium]
MTNRYTHGHHDAVVRSHRWRTAANSAAYLTPLLEPGMRVLDVGSGPGTITADLADLVGPNGSVTALERTERALDLSRAEIARRGVTTVDFVVGDAAALDLPDDRYDVVHAHQVLQHLADPVSALREMRRVCKPGGLVAARDADYAGFVWFPAVPELERWLDLYHRVTRANDAEADAGRRLLSWGREAGLRDLWTGSSTWCFADAADRAWWGGTWAERVVASEFAVQAVA